MPHVLRQEYLICYDIEENRLRTKLFKELRSQGLKHVQKSVFWGYLTVAELNAISRFINSVIDESDKVLITRTNFNGRGQSLFFGHGKEDFKDWEENCVI
jgi:CRISPR-associated protein Cas2